MDLCWYKECAQITISIFLKKLIEGATNARMVYNHNYDREFISCLSVWANAAFNNVGHELIYVVEWFTFALYARDIKQWSRELAFVCLIHHLALLLELEIIVMIPSPCIEERTATASQSIAPITHISSAVQLAKK